MEIDIDVPFPSLKRHAEPGENAPKLPGHQASEEDLFSHYLLGWSMKTERGRLSQLSSSSESSLKIPSKENEYICSAVPGAKPYPVRHVGPIAQLA